MAEENLASLRQKIEGVDEFLRGEVRACRRNSKIVGIAGIIVAVIIAIYFGTLYFVYFKGFFKDVEAFLEPDKLVETVLIQVEAWVPDVLEKGEELLLENSADLIEDGKVRLLEELPGWMKTTEEFVLNNAPGFIEEQKALILAQLPKIRVKAEPLVAEKVSKLLEQSEDELLKRIPKLRLFVENQIGEYAAILFREIRENIEDIAPEVIERNKEEIRKAFEELADPKAVAELKESLKVLFNEMIDGQVGEELDTYVEILHDINHKLRRLQERRRLTAEQELERDFIANFKELMFRKFEALREEPAIDIVPPEEAKHPEATE